MSPQQTTSATVLVLAKHPRSLIHVITCALFLTITGCGESTREAYDRGFRDGSASAQATADLAREEGHTAGFKEGFEIARPPSGIAPPKGGWLTASIVVMVLGMGKIVLSFVVFTVLLVIQSSSWPERAAKIIATSLAVILVFWLSNSLTLGFSRSLTDIILAPASTNTLGKFATGLVAAVLMWTFIWVLDYLATTSKGHAYIQTAYVLVSTSVVSILVPIFLSLQEVPNLLGYRFFDLILGVVIGGVCWIVQRLLIESDKLKLREEAERMLAEEREARRSQERTHRSRLNG